MDLTDVTIVIASYGGGEWSALASSRAWPSAKAQGCEVVSVHSFGGTLAQARNHGLTKVTTPWVLFLDADDELEADCVQRLADGAADLRAPAVRYVRAGGRAQAPAMPRVAGHRHACTGECLPFGNWLVIGSLVRSDLVRQVGGFREWRCFEDWDLWLRCWQAGATVEAIPSAVYRAHVRPDSRNRSGSVLDRNAVHRQIAADLGVPIPA